MPEAVISLSTIRGVKKYALADSLWEVEDMLGTKGALEPRASLPLSSAPSFKTKVLREIYNQKNFGHWHALSFWE